MTRLNLALVVLVSLLSSLTTGLVLHWTGPSVDAKAVAYELRELQRTEERERLAKVRRDIDRKNAETLTRPPSNYWETVK